MHVRADCNTLAVIGEFETVPARCADGGGFFKEALVAVFDGVRVARGDRGVHCAVVVRKLADVLDENVA